MLFGSFLLVVVGLFACRTLTPNVECELKIVRTVADEPSLNWWGVARDASDTERPSVRPSRMLRADPSEADANTIAQYIAFYGASVLSPMAGDGRSIRCT